MTELIKTFIEELKGESFFQTHKYLFFVISFISIIGGAAIYHYVKNFMLNPSYYKSKRKIEKLNDTLNLAKETGDELLVEFVKKNNKVEIFNFTSRIYTNSITVDKYILLLNKLGKKFTMRHIKRAERFLVIENDEIVPKISRRDNFFYTAVYLVSLITFFMFDFLFIFLITYKELYLDIIIISLLMIVVSILGLISTFSFSDAKAIEKRLKEIND